MTATLTTTELHGITNRCRQQQHAWAAKPVKERLRHIHQLRTALVTDHPRLCAAVEQDIGRPVDATLALEILGLAATCKFVERRAAKLLKPRKVPLSDRPVWLMGQRDTVHRRPRGVIGIIGTWNYPLWLNGVQILMALVAGNAVIWKPSEVAPQSAEALWEWLQRAGLPEGLLVRLPGTREAGKQLTDADIDHLIFTGHANTGRILAEHLGKRLISSTLELSGCDAEFVLDDADVNLAAKAAWFAATVNNGQTCLAVRRAFVDRKLYQPFLDALKPLAETAMPVKLAMPAQAEQAEQLIKEATNRGARVLAETNGTSVEGFKPTVVVDVQPEMAICRKDSFAPIMAVIPYDTLAEAVAASKQCEYHLAASIFTSQPQRALALAEELQVGMVTINDVIAPMGHPATPFGGNKLSGWGVTQGAEGLLEMTVPQVVSVKSGSWRPHYDPPGSSKITSGKTIAALLQWSHGATWWQRLKGFFRMIW
jgi:acyl-CoA reductase-like NAD-dependent aldehyde dehydrogenase